MSDIVIDAVKMRVTLCKGLRGRMVEIDSNGDIKVMFPSFKAYGFGSGLHWIVMKNFCKLYTLEKDQKDEGQI